MTTNPDSSGAQRAEPPETEPDAASHDGRLSRAEQIAIDGVEAPVAVLDDDGRIIAVNAAWIAFGADNGRPDAIRDVGQPYPLDAVPGVGDVIDGEAPSWSSSYPCHSPTEERWFRLLAVRLGSGHSGRVATIHRRLDDAPTAEVLAPVGEELARRWHGIETVCGWCERQVRDALGRWVPGRATTGARVSHGLCVECAAGMGLAVVPG